MTSFTILKCGFDWFPIFPWHVITSSNLHWCKYHSCLPINMVHIFIVSSENNCLLTFLVIWYNFSTIYFSKITVRCHEKKNLIYCNKSMITCLHVLYTLPNIGSTTINCKFASCSISKNQCNKAI